MITNTSSLLTRIAALTVAVTSLILPAHAAVPGMKTLKLYSPSPKADSGFGGASLITDRYAIVGEPGWVNTIPGAAHVYDATTGALVRTLKPTVSAPGDGFGAGFAAQGSRLLVWANPTGNGDSIYLMDLATGKQLRRFTPPVGQETTFFGWSMVLTDSHAIIGAPSDSSNTGAVYIFDLNTNDPPVKITGTGGAAGDFFGNAMYHYGTMLLIGAKNHQGNKGAVYQYDMATGVMLPKIQPANVSAGDYYGRAITGWGPNAFVTAYQDDTASGTNAGSVYYVSMTGIFATTPFNIDPTPGMDRGFGWIAMQEGNLMVLGAGKELLLADASRSTVHQVIPFTQLGFTDWPDSWSLASNRVLIGLPYETTYGNDSGTAYLIQLAPEPLAGEPIATKGDSAPGAAGIAFNDLNSASINDSGRVLFASSLSGTGSSGGTDKGVFDDLATAGLFDLAAKSRSDLGGGLKISSLSAPSLNDGNGLFQAVLIGTGVTSLNNKSVMRDNGTATSTLLRTGQTITDFGGSALLSFGQIGHSINSGYFATNVTLRVGTGGTTAANDSGLIFVRQSDGAVVGTIREGAATPIMGITYGQINPRVGYEQTFGGFTAMLSGPVTENQAFFRSGHNSAPVIYARKGAAAPDAGGALFSSFIGETVSVTAHPVVRATLSGAGVTTANNEGIWRSNGTLKLIARTGSPAPVNQTGVLWHRFLQVCPQVNGTLIRALLRGPGVTATNDEILCLHTASNTMQVLLREGDYAHGCNGAKVGPISLLEASAYGPYRLIVSLIGAASTNNLGLFGADASDGNDTSTSSVRRPRLILRKGSLMTLSCSTPAVRVSSFAFTHAGSQDATGMGSKGLPSVIGSNGTLVKLTLSDGTTQLVKLN